MHTFIREIKKYKPCEVINQTSIISRQMLINNQSAAELEHFVKSNTIIDFYEKKGSLYLCAWHLNDICYQSIYNSSDFANNLQDENIFFDIYNKYINFDESLSEKYFETIDDEDKLFIIGFGITQKEFWYQTIGKAKPMRKRLKYIIKNSDIKVEKLLTEKYDLKYDQIDKILLILLSKSLRQTELNLPLKFIGKEINEKEYLNSINVLKILEIFSINYEGIRTSTLGVNQLYKTPIIYRGDNRYLFPNCYLILRLYSEGLYWIVRDICKEKKLQINSFLGISFEEYINKLLKYYLNGNQYKWIEKNNNYEQPDLMILSKNITLIIEIKFSIINISFRDFYFDYSKVEHMFQKYIKAINQVNNYQTEQNGKIIKLILSFEEFFMIDSILKPKVLSKMNIEYKNDIFFINIEDFETLIKELSENYNNFEKIIIEKCELEEKREYYKGVEFNQIYARNDIKRSTFVDYI